MSISALQAALSNQNKVAFGKKKTGVECDGLFTNTKSHRQYCAEWSDSRCPAGNMDTSTRQDWVDLAHQRHQPDSCQSLARYASGRRGHGSGHNSGFSIHDITNYFSHLSGIGWAEWVGGALLLFALYRWYKNRKGHGG